VIVAERRCGERLVPRSGRRAKCRSNYLCRCEGEKIPGGKDVYGVDALIPVGEVIERDLDP
jgi:hypothetical protein